MKKIYNCSEAELTQWLKDHGEKPFHAKQIFEWLYQKKARSWDQMSNLSKELRQKLADDFHLHSLKLKRIVDSSDKETTKFLWELVDGNLDEIPEQAFLYCGGLEDVYEKAKKLQAVGA